MTDGNIDWALSLICLLVGIGLGALGYYLLNANSTKNRKLRQRMAETELELNQMREKLNTHFSQVTELAGNIQRQSQELQARLTASADQLCDDAQLKQRLHQQTDSDIQDESADTSLHVPRDYAENSAGTLDESYSVRAKREKQTGELPQPPRY